MKNLILAFIVVTTALENVKSQNSFPIFSGNPTWHVYDQIWAQIKTEIFQYVYDTTFCGQQYSKVISTPDSIIGYVRVSGDKAYTRLSNNCLDQEFLFYDFSLNAGDTAVCGYDGGDSTKFWLTQIDTVNYLGIDRQRFYMNYYMGVPPFAIIVGMYWIKGIGSTTHPFYPLVCLSDNCERTYYLMCYDSSGTQLYQSALFSDCDTTNIVGIQETTENTFHFSVNPNPFNYKLVVQLNNYEETETTLYDITSRKIMHQKFTNSVTLNTEQLAKGIYLYEVRNKNGVIKKGKVVKD